MSIELQIEKLEASVWLSSQGRISPHAESCEIDWSIAGIVCRVEILIEFVPESPFVIWCMQAKTVYGGERYLWLEEVLADHPKRWDALKCFGVVMRGLESQMLDEDDSGTADFRAAVAAVKEKAALDAALPSGGTAGDGSKRL